MIIYFAILSLLAKAIVCQAPSPCPDILTYEERGSENDRWYATIALSTSEDLNGIWMHIILDRPAELLGNWFGDSSSSDNTEFTIRNSKYKLEAGPPVSIRFFVKYNPARTIPSVKTIRLNGITICPSTRSGGGVLSPTAPTLHTSQNKPTQSATNTDNNSQDSRPSGSNNGGSRPSNSGSSTNRPSGSNNNNANGRPTPSRPNRPTERPTSR